MFKHVRKKVINDCEWTNCTQRIPQIWSRFRKIGSIGSLVWTTFLLGQHCGSMATPETRVCASCAEELVKEKQTKQICRSLRFRVFGCFLITSDFLKLFLNFSTLAKTLSCLLSLSSRCRNISQAHNGAKRLAPAVRAAFEQQKILRW